MFVPDWFCVTDLGCGLLASAQFYDRFNMTTTAWYARVRRIAAPSSEEGTVRGAQGALSRSVQQMLTTSRNRCS